MEDTNTMTVEFLRARLLSERSISRSARQRSEELAKRVAELEEQLMIVSLQRKKAEKATVDVLAILENIGINDFSGAYYSSSDQETSYESKVGNDSAKKGESDLDFSSVNSRSLSWKDRKGTSNSLEKYKDAIVKRRSRFSSIGYSSPKHRQGKSRRQIKRKESRSAVEECKTDSASQLNGTATSESGRGRSGGDYEMQNRGEQAMEKALEHQAQLIGRYEAMEKAQRDWEDKFRENNSTTPDSCDPGNHSDVTEERDEIKGHALHLTEKPVTPVTGRKNKSTMANEAQKQNILEKSNTQKQDRNSFSIGEASGTHKEAHYDFSGVLESLKQAKLSLQLKINNVPQTETRHVRKALKRSSVPVMNPRPRAEIPAGGCAGLFKVPIDFSQRSSQLTTLPDYYPDMDIALATYDNYTNSPYRETRHNTTSNNQLSGDRFFSSPYRDTVSTNDQNIAGDRFFSSPLPDTRSSLFSNGRNLTRPYLDPRSDQTSYSNHELNIPTHHPIFPDPSSRMPPIEGYSGPRNGAAAARSPSPDHFSFYDNHIKPNMYR